MKHNHVTIFYAHIKKESSITSDPSESHIVFVRGYGVNGVLVDCEWAELRFTPFGELRMRRLSEDEKKDRHPSLVVPYEFLLNSYTAEDWLEESTDEMLVIPVSSFAVAHKPEGMFTDLADGVRLSLVE